MTTTESNIRSVFLTFWHEYAVFNTDGIYDNVVSAQGQCSGKYYALTLDDDLHVIDAEVLY